MSASQSIQRHIEHALCCKDSTKTQVLISDRLRLLDCLFLQAVQCMRLPPIDFPELPILIADHEDQASLWAVWTTNIQQRARYRCKNLLLQPALSCLCHASLLRTCFPCYRKPGKDLIGGTTPFWSKSALQPQYLFLHSSKEENCGFSGPNSTKMSQGPNLLLLCDSSHEVLCCSRMNHETKSRNVTAEANSFLLVIFAFAIQQFVQARAQELETLHESLAQELQSVEKEPKGSGCVV